MFSIKNNYYFSSFFWSTLQKILAAFVGFVSVPLLLNYYGANNYGILSLATACNGYMHLLDLGMNVGTVRFFSLWWSKGEVQKVNRVATTNISFYSIISVMNAGLLIILALYGEGLFSTTHEQFLKLRTCLYILALFCFLSWGTTTFQQLLIASKQLAYTAKVQVVQTLLKLILVGMVFLFEMSLTTYFFYLSLIISLLIVPYANKCRKDGLIDSIKPTLFWGDFRIVLYFSLSIFALSLFQATASQSRPIILGIFSSRGPVVNSEYRIVEVIPQLIITISSTISTMFLPKTTEIISIGSKKEIAKFAYRWTFLTTIITCVLCIPFILGADEIISAYVGNQYSYLSGWLILWVSITLIQMHCTPAYSLIMAKGETKWLVYISGGGCLISILFNVLFADTLEIGSAIIGYGIYVAINIFFYYLIYYYNILGIRKRKIFLSFFYPVFIACLAIFIVSIIPLQNIINSADSRISYIFIFLTKTTMWGVLFFMFLFKFRLLKFQNKKIRTYYD